MLVNLPYRLFDTSPGFEIWCACFQHIDDVVLKSWRQNIKFSALWRVSKFGRSVGHHPWNCQNALLHRISHHMPLPWQSMANLAALDIRPLLRHFISSKEEESLSLARLKLGHACRGVWIDELRGVEMSKAIECWPWLNCLFFFISCFVLYAYKIKLVWNY